MGKGFSASAIAAGNEFGRVFARRIMQAMSINVDGLLRLEAKCVRAIDQRRASKNFRARKTCDAENLSTNAVDKYVQSL